jgi:signal transduction histidine kinase
MLQSVLVTGKATWSEDVSMFFARGLPLEEVYVRFMFGPILGADGRTVEGIFAPCTETTEQVVGARRLEILRKLGEKTGAARSLQAACDRATAILTENPRDVPFAAIYLISHSGTEAGIVSAAGLGPAAGFGQLPSRVNLTEPGPSSWPLSSVYRMQRAVEVDLVGLNEKFPGGPWRDPAAQSVVLPIPAMAGALAGLLVVGVSSRRVLDSSYRTFFDLVAGQISALIAAAKAFQEENRDPSDRAVEVNVLAQDITELKRAEESLRESDRRKDEFLATLSHELRNPIAPIQNAVQILKTIEAPEPRLEWCRDVIEQQIGYMARLMEDLLDVSRITRNKLELRKQAMDLRESIRDAVAISSPAMAAAGHKLTVILPPESMPLHADSTRLTQVFVNILNNAAKYMDKSGQIWLGVKVVPGEKKPRRQGSRGQDQRQRDRHFRGSPFTHL